MTTTKKRTSIKVKEHENLTNSNIEKVISLLECTNPITKKEACEVLNIAYNTTRLSSIIDGYKAKIAHQKKMRDMNRGKPISEDEIGNIVSMYIQGVPISEISDTLFRPIVAIKNVIERLGVPKKPSLEERAGIGVLPEQCIADSFSKGQLAWSAAYHSICEILEEVNDPKYEEKYSSKCYKIYIYQPLEDMPDYASSIKKGGFYAYSLAYNLGSLEHLSKYHVNIV